MSSSAWVLLAAVLAAAGAAAAVPTPGTGTAKTDYVQRLGPLPGAANPLDQYSGYLTVNSTTGSYLYYQFFEIVNASQDTPVTLWLNGGPGASSLLGLYTENGPTRIDPKTKKPVLWGASWSQKSHMIFIDQPVGTGFSITSGGMPAYPTSAAAAAEQLHAALASFYDSKHFARLLPNEFLLTGESYAGKYLPATATSIQAHNARGDKPWINLAGVAIGDGWVHPVVQNPAYCTYAYNIGLMGPAQKETCDGMAKKCVDLIHAKKWDEAQTVSNQISNYVVECGGGVDINDIEYAADNDPIDALMSALPDYLNDAATKSLLNVPDSVTWNMFDNNSYTALNADEQQSVAHLVPALLDAGVRVWLYTGSFDINCNLVGVEAWLPEMGWKDYSAYLDAKRVPWTIPDSKTLTGKRLAGYAKQHGPLNVIVIRNAGHLVPYFTPDAALAMFDHFVQDKAFTPDTPRSD